MPRFAARAFHWLSVLAILVLASSAPLAAKDRTPLSASQALILEGARSYVLDYTHNLPNFICDQFTNRTVTTSPEQDSAGPPPTGVSGLTPAGINSQLPSQSTLVSEGSIEEKLTYINWEEHYEVIAINGRKATSADPEQVGERFQGENSALSSALSSSRKRTPSLPGNEWPVCAAAM